MARLNKYKLATIVTKNKTLQTGLRKLSESFRHVVNATSNNPATIKVNQAIGES